MKNIIIGTAGHIDHGKTTLIKALTGRNTDTLEEEEKRGISINLGFTYFDLPNGKRAGIVDVPGHEKFLKNMLAGATGIDLVLLIVAANEGVMPQTVEHMEILSYLDIKEKIIVVTKCSLVDEDMISLVEDDVRDTVKDTIFEDAPIALVDSVTGMGMDHLVELMVEYSEKIEGKNESSAPRMNIDRIFSLKGFGTIVTGTMNEGIVRVGDELTIYPKGIKTKIRSIQVHDQPVEVAKAGQRSAMNLANVKTSDIIRGDVLAKTDSIIQTCFLDTKIKLTKRTEKKLKLWERLRIYLGTKEVLARFVPLDKDVIGKDEECFCQLRLEEEIAVKKGDKFVIRTYSPMETIGGGVVLDPNPNKHGKADKQAVAKLVIHDTGSTEQIVGDFIKQNGSKRTDLPEIITYMGLSKEEVQCVINELVKEKQIIQLGNYFLHCEILRKLHLDALELLSDYHKQTPLRKGMSREELRSKLKLRWKAKDFELLLKRFEEEKTLKIIESEFVSIYDFKVEYTEKQIKIKDKIEKKITDGGFTPPSISELISSGNKEELEVLDSLVGNTVVRLNEQTYIGNYFYQLALDHLKEFLSQNKTITLGEFRDLIQTSRKFAMAILDYFDRNQITRRVGDDRKIY